MSSIQARPKAEERQREAQAAREAESRGQAVPHMRPAHRLLAAHRRPLELRGRRAGAGVPRRLAVRLRPRRCCSSHMQPMKRQRDAWRRGEAAPPDKADAALVAQAPRGGGIPSPAQVGGPARIGPYFRRAYGRCARKVAEHGREGSPDRDGAQVRSRQVPAAQRSEDSQKPRVLEECGQQSRQGRGPALGARARGVRGRGAGCRRRRRAARLPIEAQGAARHAARRPQSRRAKGDRVARPGVPGHRRGH